MKNNYYNSPQFQQYRKGEKKLTDRFGVIPETSGIYVFTRNAEPDDSNKFNKVYIGQAKDLKREIIAKCMGYQPISLSIKKRGIEKYDLYGKLFKLDALDYMEKQYIQMYKFDGGDLYNKTTGGNKGKKKIGEQEQGTGMHLKDKGKEKAETYYTLLKLITKTTHEELDSIITSYTEYGETVDIKKMSKEVMKNKTLVELVKKLADK